MRTKLRSKVTLLFMMLGMLLAVPAIALADNFQNTLAATETGTRTITTDGTTPGSTTVGYRIIATGGDGSPSGQNCNASDGTPLNVTFNVPGVTATPSSLQFTSCGNANTQDVTFSSTTPGTYNIDPGIIDTGTSTYVDQSAFTLHVQGTGTSVTDVSGSGTSGQSDGSLSAKLVWNNNNVGGKTISFAIDKQKNGTFENVCGGTGQPTCPQTENTTGVATLSNVSLAGLAPGTYDLKATFAGDSNYVGANTTGTLTVNSADDEAPTSTHSLSSAANANGWHNSDVTVTLEATDNTAGSGVKEIRYSINGGASSVYDEANKPVISTEGTTTFSYFAVDNNDNVENPANSVQIKLDKTAPEVAYQSATPAANANGWNNTNVTATFEANDPLSGMGATDADKTATNTATTSGEGTNISVGSPAFTDRAGNTAVAGTATSPDFKIDKTKPVVSVTGVSNSATYTLGSVPTAGCDTTDQTGLSGVKTPASLSVTGGPVGSVTATCSGAEDNAGNTNSASVTYNVNYNWSGFFQPIDNKDGNGNYIPNKAKAGSVIPVKFSLAGNQGDQIFATGSPSVVGATGCVSGTSDLVEEYAPANASGLKYDPIADQYIYNWKTQSNYVGKCLQLNVKLSDNTTHSALFSFVK